MKRTKWIVLLAVFAMVVAACGDDDAATETTVSSSDLSGTTVTVFGPESSDEEAGAMQDALDVFAAESGIEILYTGARDFSDQINAQAAGGNPPDIGIFPQPGKVADFGAEGFILPVPDDIVAATAAQWPEAWMAFGNSNGAQYGIPNKSDLKSLVWYKPSVFAANGYEIPTTLDALYALSDQMIADGITPWCVGIESGPATGWTFTDWVEDLTLRRAGVDFYDSWVVGDTKFSDPQSVAIWNEILDLWNTDGAVYAAGGSIAATPFGDNGEPLVAEDCAMHRQASFFAAFMPEGTSFGDDGDVSVFYFPAADASSSPVLVAGTLAAAFRDAPEVWAVMEYLGSTQYGNERQVAQQTRKGGALSGYLTANLGVDLANFLPLEQSFVTILQTGGPARFDASDLMPASVGSGAFWVEATSAVNGDKSVEDALKAIDDTYEAEMGG
jgi:alpha-glucoside transport system substrate-binding protein